MLRIGTTVMGVEDLDRAVAFWCAALGYRPKRDIRPDDDFMILVPDDGEGPALALDVVDSIAPQYPRVHLDLYAGDTADQHAEVERLVSLGASRVDWEFSSAESDFIVLADTEGNRFCVIDTTGDPDL
jgi:catechol 2,3-dioxygenase-like lactoylglutathione lyase family enzyme